MVKLARSIQFWCSLVVWANHAWKVATLSYDRAGLGWTEHYDSNPTADGYAKELNDLLSDVFPSRNYVLVAHSFGTCIARRYNYLYHEKIDGMVLIEMGTIELSSPLQAICIEIFTKKYL